MNFNCLSYKKAKAMLKIYRSQRGRERKTPRDPPGVLDSCPKIPSSMLFSESQGKLCLYSSQDICQGNKMPRVGMTLRAPGKLHRLISGL